MVRLPVILHIHVKTSYSYLLLTFNGNFHFYAQTGVEGTYGAEENSFHFAYTVVSVVTVSAANPRLKQQCNGSMKSNPSPAKQLLRYLYLRDRKQRIQVIAASRNLINLNYKSSHCQVGAFVKQYLAG